jgi:leucyl aminopeptidase
VFNEAKKIAQANSKITVEQFTHSFNQPSVIVRLPGETDDLSKPSSRGRVSA